MDVIANVLAALAAEPKNAHRLLGLHTPLGPDVLVAEMLDGMETLDHGGFRFELTALSIDAHLDLAALLGQPVLLELQTDDALGERRPFHGHVSAFERVGSNGGLARYRLRIEPWLAFLDQRVDSFVFQGRTVVEIAEEVFADYGHAGKLVPAWRWDVKDPSVYRQYSLCTQYHESDLAFLHRLLAEEGIHYHFEHEGDPASEHLGRHVMVLADHNEAFAELGPVRFHRRDETERGDSVQAWRRKAEPQAMLLRRSSWNYRTHETITVEAGEPSGPFRQIDEATAAYAWPDRATGERLVQRHYQAHRVRGDVVHGQGSWRQLRPGARFELTQHPQGGRFACLAVRHRARNNLGADVVGVLEQTLGRANLPALALPEALDAHAAQGPVFTFDDATADPALTSSEPGPGLYDNRFHGIPEDRCYRPPIDNDQGEPLHPKPIVRGTLSAIVVTDGAPIQTDRDHRIRIQFPWQRGANASSRQGHPAGDDNAPGTDAAWTWVRVSAAWAGDNWGSVLLPRRGQEVLVGFIDGDIDRPVVTGAVHNGVGQADAPHNRVAGGAADATGNAPAWFDGNRHNAVFTGFKSQALGSSQTGSGGYQQLRLDDTPGQGRVQASTTQRESTVALGHLKGGRDNVREGERGFGIELSTAASGAIRAGAGLLLSTEAGRQQLDAGGAHDQLAQGGQLLTSLHDVAKAQAAALPGEADTLPAATTLKTLGEHLAATRTAAASGNGVGGGDGEAPAWTTPALVASSPDGLAALTPADQVWVSGTEATLTANSDLHWLSQRETVIAVQKGIALYTHGSAAPAGKPDAGTGIALHAAQGPVSASAATGAAELAARTSVTLASTTADVQLAAPNRHLLATAAGACIKLEGDDIEIAAPGTIGFRAAKKEWVGPQSASPQVPPLVNGKSTLCDFKMQAADAGGDGVVPVG